MPEWIRIELLQRGLAVGGCQVAMVLENRDRPLDRMAQDGEGTELIAQHFGGAEREVTGDDLNLVSPRCVALEQIFGNERAVRSVGVVGPWVELLGIEVALKPPPQ